MMERPEPHEAKCAACRPGDGEIVRNAIRLCNHAEGIFANVGAALETLLEMIEELRGKVGDGA